MGQRVGMGGRVREPGTKIDKGEYLSLRADSGEKEARLSF